MFGLFRREPCFSSPEGSYKINPHSPTLHADQLISSASTMDVMNDGSRKAQGKELVEKLENFKQNDPAGYAQFNSSLKEKGAQGGSYMLLRDNPSVFLNNFDRITNAPKSGQSVLSVVKDLQAQTEGKPSERDVYEASKPQATSVRQQMIETLEPLRAPQNRGMYNTPPVGVYTPSQGMSQAPFGGMERGGPGSLATPGFGGGSGGFSMGRGMSGGFGGFSGLGAVLTSVIGSFMQGFKSGDDVSNATEGFQRHSSRAVLDNAPQVRMPFNMGGQNFGNVLQGLDLAGLRQGNMSMGGARPPGADLVMGGGIGGGMTDGLRNTGDVIGRAMTNAFKL